MLLSDVKRSSSGEDTDIKLQLFHLPNDLCVDLLSNGNFTEVTDDLTLNCFTFSSGHLYLAYIMKKISISRK